MASYLDTSFLLKIYIREADSDEVADLVSTRDGLLINSLSEVELASALFRKFPRSSAEQYLNEFAADRALGIYRSVLVDEDVYVAAVGLCRRYSFETKLRSLDALHLATAIVYGAVELATFDSKLADAALAAGLKVIPARS